MKRRWETETRYYVAWLHRDLFGEWAVLRVWGGKQNGLGNAWLEAVASEEDGLRALEAIGKIRIRHGYREVVPGG